MSPAPAPLTFVFGFRSPYAWLAHRLIEDRLSEAARAGIAVLPFWNPRPATRAALEAAGGVYLYAPMSRTRRFYILHDVRRLAAHFGYRITWPVDREDADWELPHAAYLAACRAGEGPACLRGLFAARFERGEDICDRRTVRRLTGYDDARGDEDRPSEARVRHGEARVRHGEAGVRHGDDGRVAILRRCGEAGVFGLPFFLAGRQSFWGLDRLPFALAAAGLPGEIGATFFQPAPAPRDVPVGEVPRGEVPRGEVPRGEVPRGEIPKGEIPRGEVPRGEVPVGDVARGELPRGDGTGGDGTVGHVTVREVTA